MAKQPNKYQFKTVKEIVDVATIENIANITESFNNWLKTMVAYRETPKFLQKAVKLDDTSFGWIDDGKMDMHVLIKTPGKKDKTVKIKKK